MNSASVAREEDIKRQVNEAIEGGLWPDGRNELVLMRCECGSHDCVAMIMIRMAAYEAVRENPRRFILARGHELPEVERVIERTPGYLVVEKIGLAGEIAEDSDPRGEDTE